jgi:hypothetical protein
MYTGLFHGLQFEISFDFKIFNKMSSLWLRFFRSSTSKSYEEWYMDKVQIRNFITRNFIIVTSMLFKSCHTRFNINCVADLYWIFSFLIILDL